MSKIAKKLNQAKYGDDPVTYLKSLPNVESVVVVHDEIMVTYKRSEAKKILWDIEYGRSYNDKKDN